MDYQDIETLKQSFQDKSSEELLEIWQENDQFTWREEAFVAIREILTRRNVRVPEQKALVDTAKPMSSETRQIIRGALMLVSGILIVVACVKLETSYVVLPTGLILAGGIILSRHGVIR